MVCSPIRSARLFPTSADAKISAAPDVPVSMRTTAGSVIDPSPDAAAIVSRELDSGDVVVYNLRELLNAATQP